MLSLVGENGQSQEDQNPDLAQWEFHDLLFHTRSRPGRHHNPVGATYRFLGRIEPLPAVKPASPGTVIPLYKPDIPSLMQIDRPFTEIVENRRSIREPGETPISSRQLGEFLYRSARVKKIWNHSPHPQERTNRPYPSGGAIYELELYIIVDRCLNLAAGLYHYNPIAHQLHLVSSSNPHIDELLDFAHLALNSQRRPQILIVMAARYQRLAWKYQSSAYALLLKHVGALFQTMYLVATAMDLAPCAIGFSNSDHFSQATGLDYYLETSVGEFALSSRGSEGQL
jgi:SagB-type dehydrogenase family enzyme